TLLLQNARDARGILIVVVVWVDRRHLRWGEEVLQDALDRVSRNEIAQRRWGIRTAQPRDEPRLRERQIAAMDQEGNLRCEHAARAAVAFPRDVDRRLLGGGCRRVGIYDDDRPQGFGVGNDHLTVFVKDARLELRQAAGTHHRRCAYHYHEQQCQASTDEV